MSYGPFGKRVSKLPIEQGGTRAGTPADARKELDVPSLTLANTFKGAQTLESNLTVEGTTALNGVVNVTDEMNLTGAANNHQVEGAWLVGGSASVGGTLEVTGETTLVDNVTAQAALSVVGKAFLFGGLAFDYVAKTADYTLTANDCIVDVTANSPTLTLPTAVGASGQAYILTNTGAGTVTMATTSGQTIGGAAPGTIAAGAVLRVFSDNANWKLW